MRKFSKRYKDLRKDKEQFLMRAIESDKEREDQKPIQTGSNYGKERFSSF